MFKSYSHFFCLVLFSVCVFISCNKQDVVTNLRTDLATISPESPLNITPIKNEASDLLSNIKGDINSAIKNTLPIIYVPMPPSGTPTAMMLVAPPSGGIADRYFKMCRSPEIDGFLFTAKCKNSSGDIINASVNFSNCIKNYDGNLRIFDGRDSLLYAKFCDVNSDEKKIVCKCEQPGGGFKKCDIKLNDVFRVVNGQLKCYIALIVNDFFPKLT
jgi:hypothetical protein